MAMDVERVPAVPALPPCCWCRRRIQRQIHERTDDIARRRAHHAGGSYPCDVPQLLPARVALDVRRRATREGCVMSKRREAGIPLPPTPPAALEGALRAPSDSER